jgi:hypothetical protein
MNARVVLWAFIAAVVVVHGVVAWMAPLAADDWDALVWFAQHRHDPHWLSSFVSSHYTFTDITTYVIARHTIVHVILTPLAGLATVFGVFVLATRRRPRFDDWSDVTGIVVIAAVLWIAAPRVGLVYFHRPFAATWLYSTALAIWFFVPLRCGYRPRGAVIAVIAIAGFLVGTSTRQLGLLALVVTLYSARARDNRGAWLWITLVAVAAGTAVGFVDFFFDFRGIRPGFELTLVALNLPIYEGGEVIALVLGLAMTKLVVGKLWPQHTGASAPDASETLRWLGVWLAYAVFALLGPRYSEATLFPTAAILTIAAYPHVRWVMTSRPMRLVVIALAIAINVVAWSTALSRYAPLSSEYRARRAALSAAPRNTVAQVTTYSQIRPTFWAFGEDWNDAARRQLIATEIYRLRDIELTPPFRRLETNPNLAVRLETEGVTAEQLRAAGAPEAWAGTLRAARVQFDVILKELRRTVKTPFTARLVIGLDLDVLRGRPLLGAVYEAGQLTTLRVSRKPPDDESRQGVAVRPKTFPAAYPEAYAVIGTRTSPVTYNRAYRVQALTTELHAFVACDPRWCILVDAFIPAF